MTKYRKKPVEIEAEQTTEDTALDVAAWIRSEGGKVNILAGGGLLIETLEGTMRADAGDYVIRGVQGEFYPCKPDIFVATYDPTTAEPKEGAA